MQKYPELASSQESPASDTTPPKQTETAMQVYEAFSQTLQLYESRVASYEAELKEERAARLAAEIRASEAETELRILKDIATENAPQGEKLTFWQRIFGR